MNNTRDYARVSHSRQWSNCNTSCLKFIGVTYGSIFFQWAEPTLPKSAPFQRYCRFLCSWPPYFTLILGISRCTRSPMLGSIWAGTLNYSVVKLFSKYSTLCEKHSWSMSVQTSIIALCVASRGKNRTKDWVSHSVVVTRDPVQNDWPDGHDDLMTDWFQWWPKACYRHNKSYADIPAHCF